MPRMVARTVQSEDRIWRKRAESLSSRLVAFAPKHTIPPEPLGSPLHNSPPPEGIGEGCWSLFDGKLGQHLTESELSAAADQSLQGF